MKSIVLGIMIASVSMAFAQTETAPGHQLKDRFSAKQQMKVQPIAADVNVNAQNGEPGVLSKRVGKSNRVYGVIEMDQGVAMIVVKADGFVRYMTPLNLPKQMAVNGQGIQFTYTISDTKMPKNSKSEMNIMLYDVSMSPRK